MVNAILICTMPRNEEKLTSLIRSIFPPRRDLHVNIIVNGCTSQEFTSFVDKMRCITRQTIQPNFKHLEEGSLAAARNVALSDSRPYEYVAFVDDDVLLSETWLSAFAELGPECPYDVLTGPVNLPADLYMPEWLDPRLLHYLSIGSVSSERKLVPFGCNLILRTKHFINIRFDERLGRKGASLQSGEEVLFLRQTAYTSKFCSTLSLTHNINIARIDPNWFIARARAEGHSRAHYERTLAELFRNLRMLFGNLIRLLTSRRSLYYHVRITQAYNYLKFRLRGLS